MKYLNSFFVAACLGLSSAAMAEIHTYKIPGFASTEKSCKETDSWLAERFARLADASVLSHGCEMNASRTYDLVIEYAKPVAANLVSTFAEYDYVHGLYDSAKDCVAHQNEDVAIFNKQTGLEALFSYCYQEPISEDMDRLWTMRIDGFGAPKKSPRHLSEDFSYGISGDISALTTHLKSTLEIYGAADAKVKITSTPDRATIHAFYYSEKSLPIVHFNDGRFKSIQECENYRDDMREVFARAGGQSAIFFCGTSPYLSTVLLYTAGTVTEPLATEFTTVKYGSLSACEAKRVETEATWRNDAHKNIVGSLCSLEEDIASEHTRMRMFWLE